MKDTTCDCGEDLVQKALNGVCSLYHSGEMFGYLKKCLNLTYVQKGKLESSILSWSISY